MMNKLAITIIALLMLSSTNSAMAHDSTHPEQDAWYRDLRMPDNPGFSCCGEADAYWADTTHVRNGRTYAMITDNRDDAALGRHHVPLNTEIEIPDVKLKFDAGNPTGHAVVFLNINNQALCYVQGSGI